MGIFHRFLLGWVFAKALAFMSEAAQPGASSVLVGVTAASPPWWGLKLLQLHIGAMLVKCLVKSLVIFHF